MGNIHRLASHNKVTLRHGRIFLDLSKQHIAQK